MAYVSFYIGNPLDQISDYVTDEILDVHSVRILESDSAVSGFVTIDVVKFSTQKPVIETDKAADNYIDKFYRLEFIGDPSLTEVPVIIRTEIIYPETVTSIIDDVRDMLGDIGDEDNGETVAFPDKELVRYIRFAAKQLKGSKNISRIDDSDLPIILILVQEHVCGILAAEHAKHYEIKTPTVSLNKWEIGQHYTQLAEFYGNQYAKISKRLNLENGGFDDDMVITQMPGPKIVTATRFSKSTGKKVRRPDSSYLGRKHLKANE